MYAGIRSDDGRVLTRLNGSHKHQWFPRRTVSPEHGPFLTDGETVILARCHPWLEEPNSSCEYSFQEDELRWTWQMLFISKIQKLEGNVCGGFENLPQKGLGSSVMTQSGNRVRAGLPKMYEGQCSGPFTTRNPGCILVKKQKNRANLGKRASHLSWERNICAPVTCVMVFWLVSFVVGVFLELNLKPMSSN